MVQLVVVTEFSQSATNSRETRPLPSAARRSLIASRCRALGLGRRSSFNAESRSFAPSPRYNPDEPLLSPGERARVHLEVEVARDMELWDIGRATPCMWLEIRQ